MAEDGVIPEKYPLMVLPQGGYRQRTRLNVVDSDGTAIIYYETLKGGTRLTRNLCALLKRPYILIDARRESEAEAVEAVVKFVAANEVQTLNVAGPRESGWAQGHAYALGVVGEVIKKGRAHDSKKTVCINDTWDDDIGARRFERCGRLRG